MRLTRLIAPLCALILGTAALGPGGATAQQGAFAPRLIVNDRAITGYELDQRRAFLQVLRQPGNLDRLAREALIDDRLRLVAGDRLGITVPPEEVEAGMDEFARRANLDRAGFLAELAKGGVDPQTFRDFVEAGIVWRQVVRTRFAARATVTDAEIDRALAQSAQRGGVELLLSELILVGQPGAEAEALAFANELSGTLRSQAAFAEAARQYSAAPTAAQGGALDWLPLGNLPPQIAPLVLTLAPGETSEPVPIPGGVALFQLRGLRETGLPATRAVALDWAEFLLPETATEAEAAAVRARLDTCDDLYGVARGLPEDRLRRETRAADQVPADIALELARLDDNEVAILRRPGAQVVLMLCGRTIETEEAPNREEIRAQLVNRRLAAYADGYLAELRAQAIIREP